MTIGMTSSVKELLLKVLSQLSFKYVSVFIKTNSQVFLKQ